jgi:hypothetical protein
VGSFLIPLGVLLIADEYMLSSHERFETPLALAKLMNLFFLVMIDLLGSALPIHQAYSHVTNNMLLIFNNRSHSLFVLSYSHFFSYTSNIYPGAHPWF